MKFVPSCRLSAKALTALLCAWLSFSSISDAQAFGTGGPIGLPGNTGINPTIDNANSDTTYNGNTTASVMSVDPQGNWHTQQQTLAGKYACGTGIVASTMCNGTPSKNFNITSNGICRYIDNNGVGSVLIPFNSKGEWQAFIGNIGSSVYLDLCRVPYDFNNLGSGGKIDFASALSYNDPTIPANLKVAPDSATTFAVGPISTLARIDTRSAAQFTDFNNLYEDRNGAYVHFTRQDCRTINYPDGTSESVCNPTTWYEQTYGHFTYSLLPAYASIASLRTAVRTDDGTTTLGTWAVNKTRGSNPPALNPPAIRDCTGHLNGAHWWVDVTPPEVVNDPCPAGQVGSPQDPRRRTYILQRDYQCYDGKSLYGAYPTPATQEKPGSSTYLDTCVAAAACGAANHGILNAKPTTAADLCGGGTTLGVTGNGSTTSPWIWTCASGGAVDNCSANKIACGSADGDTFTSKPTTNLCANGSTADSVTGGSSGPWSWHCSGSAGTTPKTCNATKYCAESYGYQTVSCGSGYTGNKTQIRTLNQGGVCNSNSGWSDYDTTACVPVATCTQGPDYQTVACGTGYTGTKTQVRTVNQGGVCGSNSGWSDYNTTACVPVAAGCSSQYVGGKTVNSQTICPQIYTPPLSNGQVYDQLTSAFPSDGDGEVKVQCNNGSLNVLINSCIATCFLPDTLITMADGSKKEVHDLKVGDRVQGQTQINTVLTVPNYDTEQAVYGFNGGKTFVTGGHPFMTQDGWKAIDPALTPKEGHAVPVGKLKVGDILSLDNYSTMVVTSIDKTLDGAHHVFNPRLDGDHTYYANGKLVHNK